MVRVKHLKYVFRSRKRGVTANCQYAWISSLLVLIGCREVQKLACRQFLQPIQSYRCASNTSPTTEFYWLLQV